MNIGKMIFTAIFMIGAIAGPAQADDNRVYDRIMKSQTVRCGYVVFPPFLMKDNDAKLSGISYDVFNEMGRLMGLKVEWVEEAPWDNLIAGLDAGRYDAICSFIGVSSQRATRADFLRPPLYSVEGIWVRNDEKRFAKNESLNKKSVTFASTDGTMFTDMVTTDFPLAKINSLPGTTSFTEQLLSVITGKADATIMDNYVSLKHLESNPGAIKEVEPGRIYRVLPVSSMIPMGDLKLKTMLDTALDETINIGAFQRIYDSYDVPERAVLMRASDHQPLKASK